MDVPSMPIWALYERNPNTKRLRTWMSMTPMEIESHMPHVAAATGHVVVAGLGMGMYLWNIANKPEVRSIEVLERDVRVLALFEASTYKFWPKELRKKITIHQTDAMIFKPSDHVDFFYADIWPSVGDTIALPETRRMQKNINADRVGYWTQECDFACYVMEHRLDMPPTTADYETWVQTTGLPLIGAEWPTYPRLALAAQMIQGHAKFRQSGETMLSSLTGKRIEQLLDF